VGQVLHGSATTKDAVTGGAGKHNKTGRGASAVRADDRARDPHLATDAALSTLIADEVPNMIVQTGDRSATDLYLRKSFSPAVLSPLHNQSSVLRSPHCSTRR
jgi:hypothetical protein